MEKWGWLPKSRIMVAIFNWITQEKASKGSHTSKKTKKTPSNVSPFSHYGICIFAKCCLYSSELFFHVVNVWTQKNGLRWLWGKSWIQVHILKVCDTFHCLYCRYKTQWWKPYPVFNCLKLIFPTITACIFVMSAGWHTNKGFKWETAQVHDTICMDTKNLLCY